MQEILQQGIMAYKSRKVAESRKIFISVVKQNPDNESAWGWMYQVSNNDQERIHCLKQILRINPKSEKAKQLLGTLAGNDFPFELSQQTTLPVQEEKYDSSPNIQTQKPVASQQNMRKSEVAIKIGELEGELSKLEQELREQERLLNSASGNRTAGGAALLIGLLGVLFMYPLWMLWIIFIISGALALLTAISKQNNTKEELIMCEQNIRDIRSELVKYRAQLMLL